jgi:hypothetical protein
MRRAFLGFGAACGFDIVLGGAVVRLSARRTGLVDPLLLMPGSRLLSRRQLNIAAWKLGASSRKSSDCASGANAQLRFEHACF